MAPGCSQMSLTAFMSLTSEGPHIAWVCRLIRPGSPHPFTIHPATSTPPQRASRVEVIKLIVESMWILHAKYELQWLNTPENVTNRQLEEQNLMSLYGSIWSKSLPHISSDEPVNLRHEEVMEPHPHRVAVFLDFDGLGYAGISKLGQHILGVEQHGRLGVVGPQTSHNVWFGWLNLGHQVGQGVL